MEKKVYAKLGNDISTLYDGMYLCKIKTPEDLFYMVCERFGGNWHPQGYIFPEEREVISWLRLPDLSNPPHP